MMSGGFGKFLPSDKYGCLRGRETDKRKDKNYFAFGIGDFRHPLFFAFVKKNHENTLFQ
jgi:hypothetical protein